MGRYNPRSPYILGQEWVPIRQANYLPDTITERGYTFSIDHSVVPVSGAYYVSEFQGVVSSTFEGVTSVYPADTQDLTGPVSSVTIPAEAVTITGAFISGTVSDILNPSDGLEIVISPNTGSGDSKMGINFDVGSYTNQLSGKRILDVRVLYQAAGPPNKMARVRIRTARAAVIINNEVTHRIGLEGGTADADQLIKSVSMSDMNVYHTVGNVGATEPYAYPWRQQELAFFDTSSATNVRLIVVFDDAGFNSPATDDFVLVGYVALQIFYCEERRVKYGSRRLIGVSPGVVEIGANFLPLRGTDFTVTGSLAPGDYLVTQTRRLFQTSAIQKVPIQQHALRQLYQLPGHRGITINQTLTVGSEFTSVTGNVIPHITLHHSGGIVTGVHAYGTQIQAPVYGSITAVQEIEDDPVGSATSYPQVRFYARRYGDTAVPLTLVDVATGLSTVSITASAFDALPEIVDGWREVTLRFATPPSFSTTGGDIDWRWSATNESASNQWQILAADGPSPTGTHATSFPSYFASAGDTDLLTWKGPNQTVETDDPLSDAVLIFSSDPPTITGFTVGTCSQIVTGIGLECGSLPPCIPTGISGNQLSWNAIFTVRDTFTRTTVSSWGSADTGGAYTNTGGAAADYSTNGARGVHSHAATNTPHRSTVGPNVADVDVTVEVFPRQVATGAPIQMDIIGRYADVSNHYLGGIQFGLAGAVTAIISKVVAATESTVISTTPAALLYHAGSKYGIRLQIAGSSSQLRLKVWNADLTAEPVGWTLETTDTSLTAVGQIGVRSRFNTGNTNTLPATVEFDNLLSIPASFAESTLQIQRRDSIDDWATIVSTRSLTVTGFCDLEARVGVSSDYRMRVCNVLDFCGTWVTGSGTIASPGVLGAGGANSVLIFTSNRQPSSSLAYVMSYEGTPIETFAFPEADTVQLQRMFGKDFFTAFRPLERGGDRFQRKILVNAAAIALEALANFKALRDLAWADLPYVCVRDELGNRWYATVIVPTADVRRNRTIYLAQIDVAKVTNTPSPVNP